MIEQLSACTSIQKTFSSGACPLEENVNGDEDLAVCEGVDDSSWESTFFVTLGQEPEEASEDEEDEQESTIDEDPSTKKGGYS